MADYERSILDHYNLPTAFPLEWPTEKDQSDDSDGEASARKDEKAAARARRKTQYAILEHGGGHKARRPGPAPSDPADLRDEVDPLGAGESVVRLLRRRGVPVEDNAKLRDRFLLSSKTFSASLYLSEVHSDASTQTLLQGLDYLSHSIDQKSAALKSLVEANFERFVKAKATIDDLYTEMRNRGDPADQAKPHGHSPHASRSSVHFRNTSGSGPPGSPRRSLARAGDGADRRKNALTAASDYGVRAIKEPLAEVASRADDVWGPALGGKEREEHLRAVIGSVERYRGLFEAGASVADCIKRKDYDGLAKEYERARRFAEEARDIADTAQQTHIALTVPQVHKIVVTARMWVDVDGQVDGLKRELWRRLIEPAQQLASARPEAGDGVPSAASANERSIELIRLLLELGAGENPIRVWLMSRYDGLRSRVDQVCRQFRAETEFVRRHLAADDAADAVAAAALLRPTEQGEASGQQRPSDRVGVLELWERIQASLRLLLGPRASLLAELLDFWQTARSFIEGRAQRGLPPGFDGESREHHQLSAEAAQELRRGAAELAATVREQVLGFFAEPAVDDLSILFSPALAGPGTPTLSPSPMLSPRGFNDARLRVDAANPPPPSPRRGAGWEKFAFWPPQANALSGVHYLGKLLVMVATAASEMAAMAGLGPAGPTLEGGRNLVAAVRERCVQAICAAWNQDVELCKGLEDWRRAGDGKDATRMPGHFLAYESQVLAGLQKVLYVSEAMGTPGAAELVTQPAAKVLQQVRGQFVSSLYKALSGMLENAERPTKAMAAAWGAADGDEDEAVAVAVAAVAAASAQAATELTAAAGVRAGSLEVRRLLTLSNLAAIRAEVVPQLVTQFENAFSVKLTDEGRTIRDVLGQMDARLFQAYTAPLVEKLTATVRAGILSPAWPPKSGRPTEVRGYIYAALLALVMVHTQVGTTAASLLGQVMSYLLEQLSQALLQTFKQRSKYTLAALMQATLDVEFVAQTLSQYTTDRASELQSQVYLEIDRGTDNEARRMLQNELPEMRKILKRLREDSKAEFACFKRPRPPRERGGQT